MTSANVTEEEADLLVSASRADATLGQLLLSATARERVVQAHAPALLVQRAIVEPRQDVAVQVDHGVIVTSCLGSIGLA